MKIDRKKLTEFVKEEAKKIMKSLKKEDSETAPTPVKPTTTPSAPPKERPLKIPKPGTFPKPLPKANPEAEEDKIKKDIKKTDVHAWLKKLKLNEEKERMKQLFMEAPMDIDPAGREQPEPSIKGGIEGQRETPFTNVELFSKQILNKSTLEKLGEEEFNAIVNHLGEVGKMNHMEIINAMNMIMMYERPHRAALENLAKSIVKQKFGLSDEIMEMIEAKLKNPNEIDSDNDNTPEEEVEEQFTPEELELIKKHADKRKIHNALMMGSGYRAHKVFSELKNSLDAIDPRLEPIYKKMMPNVELFLWKMPVEDMVGARQNLGKSEIKCDGETCKAEASAALFPILLHEVAKSAVEILLLQHLADVQEQHGERIAKAVVKGADSYVDEHWMKLIGPRLWKYLHDAIDYVVQEQGEDYTIVSYTLNRMATMQPEEFMAFMDNVLYNGPEAINKIREIITDVRADINDYEQQNNETPTPNELEGGEDNSEEIASLLRQTEDELLSKPKEKSKPSRKDIKNMNVDELNIELEKALGDEDYMKAAQIRDLLTKKK
jgi:hypothetical protein